jgi:hypothetical protein
VLPKTSTAEVSSMTVSCEKLLSRAKAVRKDSAVHVSLSSDSLVKQPGTSRLRRHYNVSGKTGAETHASDMTISSWPDERSPREQ